jgi:hypothetical protein
VYTKVAQNELAIQFFQLGFFNPQMVDQSLMCLEMMDFDDKDIVMQKIAQMGTMQQKLLHYMQLALQLAASTDPELAEQIAQDVIATNSGTGVSMGGMGGISPQIASVDNIGGIPKKEHSVVTKARQQSNDAAQPSSDGVISERR